MPIIDPLLIFNAGRNRPSRTTLNNDQNNQAMNHQTKILVPLLLTLLVALTQSTNGQSLQIPGSTPTGKVVITNAAIHPMSAVEIKSGYVAFEDGVIIEVSSGTYRPERGEKSLIIDAKGRHLYPGLIDAGTTIGLIEIGAVRATRDQSEVGNFTPEVAALTAVNPDTAIIPVTRANGILTALVTPTGGTVSGYASLINLDGWTTEDLGIEKHAGLVIRWPAVRPGSGCTRDGTSPVPDPATARAAHDGRRRSARPARAARVGSSLASVPSPEPR